nr:hypothetical protein Iba_chr09fCG11850 [Ipomoea batatas]
MSTDSRAYYCQTDPGYLERWSGHSKRGIINHISQDERRQTEERQINRDPKMSPTSGRRDIDLPPPSTERAPAPSRMDNRALIREATRTLRARNTQVPRNVTREDGETRQKDPTGRPLDSGSRRTEMSKSQCIDEGPNWAWKGSGTLGVVKDTQRPTSLTQVTFVVTLLKRILAESNQRITRLYGYQILQLSILNCALTSMNAGKSAQIVAMMMTEAEIEESRRESADTARVNRHINDVQFEHERADKPTLTHGLQLTMLYDIRYLNHSDYIVWNDVVCPRVRHTGDGTGSAGAYAWKPADHERVDARARSMFTKEVCRLPKHDFAAHF